MTNEDKLNKYVKDLSIGLDRICVNVTNLEKDRNDALKEKARFKDILEQAYIHNLRIVRKLDAYEEKYGELKPEEYAR